MRDFFENAYRTGFLPWEESGRAGAAMLSRLLERESAERKSPPGRAVDLGCGRGFHALEMAAAGWQVTGIDYVSTAVEAAQAQDGASAATFVVGDVTDLSASVQGPVDFYLDIGCFHALDDSDRAAYGRGVTALAADRATLLMLAFGPGAPFPAPPGVRLPGVEQALGSSWKIIDDVLVPTQGVSTVPQAIEVHVYRFRHHT